MQKFRKSLWIGLIALVIVVILLIVLFSRDRALSISPQTFYKVSQASKTPLKVWIKDDFLYFNAGKQIYKIWKESLDLQNFQSLIVEQRGSGLEILYYFLLVCVFGAVYVVYRLKKNIKVSSLPLFSKEPIKQSEQILPAYSDIKLENVAGMSLAKEEITDMIDFLKNPQTYKKLGIVAPKGIILIGPPGVGKTLIAKAMAGEAGVPFFYQSGSSFVQIYAGMGAKKVRELFQAAKRQAPSIIFIDEIDAVGKMRGANRSDEREATLNELLMQMDGFEDNSGVIVIGATNHAEVLDPALLRSGRFDRKVYLELPNFSDRLRILKAHFKNKQCEIDFNLVAKNSVGFSGAALATLANEAALYALKNGHKSIKTEDVFAVQGKVLFGKKTIESYGQEEKEILGIYQAAKAVCAFDFGFSFQRVGLLGDLVLLEEQSILSQRILEKKALFHLSGFLALEELKGEKYAYGEEDIRQVEEILMIMKKYQMEQDFESLRQKHLHFIRAFAQVIKKLSLELVEREQMDFDEIASLIQEKK